MNLLKNFLYILVTSLILLFCFINRHNINIHLIPQKIDIELPIYLLIIITIIIGLIIGKISALPQKIKYIFEIRNLKAQISDLKEIISKYQPQNKNLSSEKQSI